MEDIFAQFKNKPQEDLDKLLKMPAEDIKDSLKSPEFLDFDMAAQNSPLIRENARTRARDEMLEYIISVVNAEINGISDEDAFDNWQLYKELHNID